MHRRVVLTLSKIYCIIISARNYIPFINRTEKGACYGTGASVRGIAEGV